MCGRSERDEAMWAVVFLLVRPGEFLIGKQTKRISEMGQPEPRIQEAKPWMWKLEE